MVVVSTARMLKKRGQMRMALTLDWTTVIPAKAGIQRRTDTDCYPWIPAFAGMTKAVSFRTDPVF